MLNFLAWVRTVPTKLFDSCHTACVRYILTWPSLVYSRALVFSFPTSQLPQVSHWFTDTCKYKVSLHYFSLWLMVIHPIVRCDAAMCCIRTILKMDVRYPLIFYELDVPFGDWRLLFVSRGPAKAVRNNIAVFNKLLELFFHLWSVLILVLGPFYSWLHIRRWFFFFGGGEVSVCPDTHAVNSNLQYFSTL